MISLNSRKTASPFLFIFASLVLLACGFSAVAQPCSPPANTSSPQHLALLVGISAYGRGTNPNDGFGDLKTEPDLTNMSYVLKTYYSFPETEIHILRDESATQENIAAEFKRQLICKAKPGDRVVFYYTGHGHYVTDTSGDEVADHLDEVLVTWVPKAKQALEPDQRHALMYMLDDRYESLLKELSEKMKGADGKVAGSITIIFDSCHSGSANKGGFLVAKGRPWRNEIDGPMPAGSQTSEAASGWLSRKDTSDGVIFLAASQSGELSYMMPDSDKKQGSILTYNLTEFLTSVARGSSGNVTYKQLFDSVASRVSWMKGVQSPQIEGPIDTLIFGEGKAINVQPLPIVRQAFANPARLQLSEGFLHGVTKGSRYDTYRGGKDVKDPANKMAEIEITEVDSTTSTGTISNAMTPTPKPTDYLGAQAVATASKYEGNPLKILIAPEMPADKSKPLITTLSPFAFVTQAGVSGSNFDVRLGWCGDTTKPEESWCKNNKNTYFFQRANSSVVSLGPTVNADSLKKRLLGEWHWQRLAGLTLAGVRKVRLEMTMSDGSPVRRTAGNRISLKPGDTVNILCANESGSPMFITLIYLKDSGDIDVYPGPEIANAQQALNADCKPVKLFELSGISAPNGKEVEILKIIATPRQVDFSGLHYEAEERKAKSRGPNNPMEELLLSIKDGNAKGGSITTAAVANWSTDQIVYEIDPN